MQTCTFRRRHSVRHGAIAAFAVGLAALAGCAGYSPKALPPGTPLADITATMGAPTGRYTLADGTQRVEYARGPAGRHTYMLDLDAQGRLARWEQVLTENNFNAILAGMDRDTVLTRLGRPSAVRGQGWPAVPGVVWSYRYETTFCQWFQMSIDMNGKVLDTGYAPDPRCDDDDAPHARLRF